MTLPPPLSPTVVQFGAGCIGRGFLAPLWLQAGCAEIVFVDIQPELVDALNARREYPLRLTDGETTETITVAPVRALHRHTDHDQIVSELARCAFAATAVGVENLPDIAPLLAAGGRARRGAAPPEILRVLCCENGVSAAADLYRAAAAAIGQDAAEVVTVPTSVGRMVPRTTPELRAEDALLIRTEPFGELYVDALAWGTNPAKIALENAAGVRVTPDCAAFAVRKLYLHNGGHALLAYRGKERGHVFIHDAVRDPALRRELRGFWDEAGAALSAEYGFSPVEQAAYRTDLLRRLENRALGDTLERVGRDPVRKLRRDDRLVGPALLCLRHNIAPEFTVLAIAAAVRAALPAAATARKVADALTVFSGLPPDSPLIPLVETAALQTAQFQVE